MRKLFVPCLVLGLLATHHAAAEDAAVSASAADMPAAPAQHSPVVVQAPILAKESGFVTTSGTQFSLDGQPFTFQGTNFYRLSLIDHQTDQQVYDIMRQYSERSIRVVRVWGFSCGDYQAKRPMLKSVAQGEAVYDEVAMHRLDLAIDAARTYGIKIILPLVNFQSDYCPMSWWVKQVTGSSDQHDFYSSPFVRKAFKKHISTLLHRENAVYRERRGESRTYADDPTIMAIELSNEAHTEDNYETKRGGNSGDLVYHWLAEMSFYVRNIDKNHLISTGEEGYKKTPSSAQEASKHAWLSDGSKGVDFSRNLSLATIDFATIHPYPGNWGIPASDMDWFVENFIADRGAIAHGQGKPIVLEETGFSFRDNAYLGYIDNPAKYLSLMYKAANQAHFGGTMAWELVPPNTEFGDFIFDFNHPMAATIFQQAGYMMAPDAAL